MARIEAETHVLEAGDGIPNNRFALVVYRGVLSGDDASADGCAALFHRNGWQGTWLNGVFSYWHYHLHAHEVLGCISGAARVGFGGDHGIVADFRAGDVVVIPAGVGHKRVSQEPGFRVVGGYPPGQNGAVTNAGEVELAQAVRETAQVPVPASDPMWGPDDGLPVLWRQ